MAENNNEVAKVAINDIGTEEDFIKAVDSTIKNFDDGDLVEGTVVKIDHDEVLLDIGYKTEGVIPSRELSIKKKTLIQMMSLELATLLKHLLLLRKTRKDVLFSPRSVHSMSVLGVTSRRLRMQTASLKVQLLKLLRAA